MELRVLKYFLAVAREENFTRAAERLHVTQPTLSRQIADLEEAYGTQLLVREPRRVRLTEEGLLLRRRAEEILSLVEETESELVAARDTVTGEVRIGAGESPCFGRVLAVIRELRESYPGVHLHVITGDAGTVTYLLERGLVDFGFVYGDLAPAEYESLVLPCADRWGVLLRRDDPLAAKEAIAADDLYARSLLVSRQGLSRDTHAYELLHWLGRPVEELDIVGTFTMLYNGALMVEERLGVALALAGIVHTEGTCLCYRPLTPAVTAIPRLVWKRGPVLSRAAQKFLERFRARYGEK